MEIFLRTGDDLGTVVPYRLRRLPMYVSGVWIILLMVLIVGCAVRQGNKQPNLYDDFDDPQYDGALNYTLWQLDPGCAQDVIQRQGVMVGLAAGDFGSCEVDVLNPEVVPLDELGIFEAQQRIASDYKGGEPTQTILYITHDISGEFWWAECGLAVNSDGIMGNFNVQNFGLGTFDFGNSLPAEYDRWYTFRLVADPETVAFSCYMDDELVGSVVPSDAEALRQANFKRAVQVWRAHSEEDIAQGRAGIVTSYTDNVRIFPSLIDVVPLFDQPTPAPSDLTQ
ncbi:MAG: hypothetical protein JXJ17_01135 [Anaerolineae bacterium]|nr:hypothetical protein [Anaerolineae bacterium]